MDTKSITKGIGNLFQGIKYSITEAMYGFKIQRKTANKFDVDVEVFSDTRNIETYKGKITPNKTLCIIPKLQRPIFYPTIFQKDGKNKIYASEKQHDNMSISYIIAIDMGLKNDLKIKSKITPKTARYILDTKIKNPQIIDEIIKSWDYEDIWTTIEVKNVGGSLDFTKFDDEYSVAFGTHSEMIRDAELMKFLLKPSDMTVLITALIGFLAGIVFSVIMKVGG